MKIKIFLMVSVCIGYVGASHAQDVEVTNDLNVAYCIDATYIDGSNAIVDQICVGAYGTVTIDDNIGSYSLTSFVIKTTDCQSSISASHNYGTCSTDFIEDCGDCPDYSVSNYTIDNQGNHEVQIRCK